jgi:SAM-dependent methyltransferase
MHILICLCGRQPEARRSQAAGRPLPERGLVGVPRGPALRRVRPVRDWAAIIAAIDASPAMTAATRQRTTALNVRSVTADFHALPLLDDSADLAIAIMCFYHSPTPERVISEISRVLWLAGTTILVTKATDSYRELADLLQCASLHLDAHDRPSLCEAAHSGNLRQLAEAGGQDTPSGLEPAVGGLCVTSSK